MIRIRRINVAIKTNRTVKRDRPNWLPTTVKVSLLAVGVEDKHGDFSGRLALVLVEAGICFDGRPRGNCGELPGKTN
jgi:hypothetical protein